MTERKMASIQVIDAIDPIPQADAIDVATIKGWKVVVKKDEFQVGDKCVYFEIDSFLPCSIYAFDFLMNRGVRKFVPHGHTEEIEGHVLRTAKLRGQVSQGLLMPLDSFGIDPETEVDADVTEVIGIYKYEPPIPLSISGEVAGVFPTQYVSKTSATRIQNVPEVLQDMALGGMLTTWVATEKIDGTSCTIIRDELGVLRVCGRNYEYRDVGIEKDNALWVFGRILGPHLKPNEFVQGEVFGEGINKNPLKMKGKHFRIFSWGYNAKRMPFPTWPKWAQENSVPILDDFNPCPKTVEEALEQVDGLESRVAPGRKAEGVVWWNQGMDEWGPIKVISNRYLMKNQD